MSTGPVQCGIVIPTYNGATLTGACLEALLSNPPQSCRWTIVVVDDGSEEDVTGALSGFAGEVKLLRLDPNGGFARACNAGAAAVGDCDHLVFLNNDTIPTAGWLDALVDAAQRDDQIGAVGAKLLFPRGQVQHAGVAIGQDGWPHHIYAGFPDQHPAVNRARAVTAATAACLLVRRQEFEALGGFDTAFHNGYEDIDLCLRLRQRGKLIWYCPTSVVYHLESVTRWPTGEIQGTETSDRVYAERWRGSVPPDDVERYLEDGLMAVAYGPHYPITLSVSPELAVVTRDGEQAEGLERLLALRSQQVMELIGAETRRHLGSGRPLIAPRAPLGPLPPPRATLVAEGRVHQLGSDERESLISVVMPVQNAADDLRELLPLVLGQSVSARLEIVAVDSGSEDETVQVLQEFGARVLTIPPEDFDHGLTRNLMAEHARGEVMVFLNKRSRPVGDDWLRPLLAALDQDPLVAGACSRVLPHDDADLLARRDAERDPSSWPQRRRAQIEDPGSYRAMSAEDRRRFLNFHTVAAAIRTAAWRQVPFRSVPTIGEDLLWAREVLEAGWALVYEPASVVQHSHTYPVGELFARHVDDGIAGHDIVGRTLAREHVLPMIRKTTLEDWDFLTEQGLSPEELEHWRLEAVLRRVAQFAGQWLGINHASLPDGAAASFSRVGQTRDQRSR